jgi:hypothetical protein
VYLGHPTDLIWSKCKFHRRLIAHLLSNVAESTATFSGHNIYVKSGDSPASLQLYHKRTYAELYELMEYSHLGDTRGFGRSIDPDWVNLSQLTSWERYCSQVHGESCRLPTHLNKKFSIRPDLLIDTYQMCLTKSEGTENYVALSYVWGDVPTLKTTIENLHSLQQPRALAHAIAESQIPLTIAHTIYLIQKLGMRYLWVDSLCIVQDDNTIRDRQIENMGSIFANGSLTIVAAEGEHANHGISGIRDISQPRQSTQDIVVLPNGIRVCHIPSVRTRETKWDTRGWTYQEEFFSPRKLIFGRARVTWECRNTEFREDFTIDRPTEPVGQRMATFENFIGTGWPDLFSYAIACQIFNLRYFTYARDANLALAGLCSILCAKYDGGFLHGLPEMFFDVALLWQAGEDLKRRSSSVASATTLPESLLPSWSWMGWHGERKDRSWSCANEFVKMNYLGDYKMTNVRTIKILDWYTGSADASRQQWRKIPVTWRKYAHLFNNDTDSVPPGWTRHAFDPRTLSDAEKQGAPDKLSVTTIYKHDSDEISEFWWSVPTAGEHAAENVLPPQTDFLFFTTSRAWFYCARDVKKWRLGASLRDKDGRWVGYMNFHDQDALDALPKFDAASFTGHLLEVVAISRGYALHRVSCDGLDELTLGEYPKVSDRYEYYNLLWIKWENGVAYRHGLGRVLKSIWESQGLETVEVVLG